MFTRTIVYGMIVSLEGVVKMKKTLKKFGGLILFYSVIIFGVLLLNLRFAYLNSHNNLANNFEVTSQVD